MKRLNPVRSLLALLIIAVATALLLMAGHGRGAAAGVPQAIPSVAVTRAQRGTVYQEVPIPAEFRPYVETEVHAMVSGYVSRMNVDIGDRVRQGDVLATLEVPELMDQLHNAMANQQQAEADFNNEHLLYARLAQVNQQSPKLVAAQDIDTARSKDESAAAAVSAARAEVEKYQTLVNYTKITAPFDGVITKRSADPGALVQAGTSADNSLALVRVSDNYVLRLDFPVSVDYVKDVRQGAPVTVRVDSLGGRRFTGTITRSTDQVNEETRTMMTEIEVQNPNLDIVPGMYAVVLFKFGQHSNALTIPIAAVADPKSQTVFVVNRGGQVEARPVKLGVEMPDRYEVTSGLAEGELVVSGNATAVHPGEIVDPKIIAEPAIPDTASP